MRFGFAVPAYGRAVDGGIAELLAAGEELGFESAWWPDHIAVPDYAAAVNLQTPFLEPLAACAWGLGRTTRLRFGTDVLVAPYRHALAVAAMIGTMGTLAGDRLVLGVGIGYLRGEFDVLGADYDARAAATEQWLRDLRAAPDGFSVIQAPARVPVWVGGNNTRAHRRAALLGDGWHPLCSRPTSTPPRATRSSPSGATPGSTVRSPSRSAPAPPASPTSPRAAGRRRRHARPKARSSVTHPSSGWRPTGDRASSGRPTTSSATCASWKRRVSTT